MVAPRVSVVTPMYNAEKYIERAVRSVLAQTWTDFEHIIIDDGSTDGCAAIVEKLAAEDGRIRFIRLERNVGNARANNHGFAAAQGDYIACMDADDICHPERLAKQVAYLDSHADIGLVATQYYKIDEDDKILRKTRNRLDDVLLRFHLLFGVPVCNPTTTFRRGLAEAFAPLVYSPAFVAAADYDFLLRVAQRTRMHVLPEYLFYYRVNSKGLSKTRKDTLVAETVPLALPYIGTYAVLTAEEREMVVRFIPLQLNPKDGLTKETLADYVHGMALLEHVYCQNIPLKYSLRVKLFALEVEAKTLLGRYKMYRSPEMVAAWLKLRLQLRPA